MQEVADEVMDWLMSGDPAIRWQVMRDLLDAPGEEIRNEQALIATEGWGARLLTLQEDDGRWASSGGTGDYYGLYTPKWTSTTYTLVLLRRMGLPRDNETAHRGCEALVAGSQWPEDDGGIAPWFSKRSDVCVNAMVLAVLEWFDFDAPKRRDQLLDYLLAHQKGDGGWNCSRSSEVSSVHTVISTLEALQVRRTNQPDPRIDHAMGRAHEYLLNRGLLWSLRTGELMHKNFRMLSFPPRWKYDVLRALDHLRCAAKPDERAARAIELLRSKQRKDGTWPVQNKHAGEQHFEMEKTGGPSRWNTLRALRVLRWYSVVSS